MGMGVKVKSICWMDEGYGSREGNGKEVAAPGKNI
jgi:hypothetical protein